MGAFDHLEWAYEHLNSFLAPGVGNLNKNFPKIQMPVGLPRGWGGLSFDLTDTLREALAGCRAHKHLRQPVLVVQFLFDTSDLATEVTPKASSTCENEADGAQRRPSTKRTLFSDSELDDEITSLISRADKNLMRTSFRLTSRLSRHNFCSLQEPF